MSFNNGIKSFLVLEDGTVFEGLSMGKRGTTFGEVVFNTCMASYNELLSDPTYYGQIVAQTFPLVGNRGMSNDDNELGIMASGYVVREWCESADETGIVTLDKYLKDNDVVGISGIDTRRLTRAVRDKGYMNGAITDSIDNINELLLKIKDYSISGAVEAITTKQIKKLDTKDSKYNVVVLDYGFPREMLTPFINRECSITIVPASTSCEEILELKPDGIILSDGPADPDDNPKLIETIKEIITKNIPVIGLGLGHQMIALATGCIVEKMPRGHRGSNQPVRIAGTDKFMVTNQNHGYSVTVDSVDKNVADINLVNVNDGSVEGLKFKNFKGMAIQFIPKDDKGYCDNSWIYDEFIELMGGSSVE